MSDSIATTAITVDAQGRVGAEFSGHVKASGIDLPEGLNAVSPETHSYISWRDPSDEPFESIVAWHRELPLPEGDKNGSVLSVEADAGHRAKSFLELFATGPSSSTGIVVEVAGKGGSIEVLAGAEGALVLDAFGRSDFARGLVSGSVDWNGEVLEGVGFTAKAIGAATYVIVLAEPLASGSNGRIVATPSEENAVPRKIESDGQRFVLQFVNLAEEATDTSFDFVIHG